MRRKPCFRTPLFSLESSQSCVFRNLEVILFHIRHLHCIKWYYIFEKRSYGVSIYLMCSLKNDSLRSIIGYLYYKIKNRVCHRQKPGFVRSNSVGSYGFSCRRKTRGHALLRTLTIEQRRVTAQNKAKSISHRSLRFILVARVNILWRWHKIRKIIYSFPF